MIDLAFMLLAANDLTPVSPAGKVCGSLLGLAGLAASVYFLSGARPVAQTGAAKPASLTASNRWRRPMAWLLALVGVMVLVGVWIDPTVHPKAFVYVWALILFLVVALFVVGGYDLIRVRQRALQERTELLKENRQELEADLKAYYKSRAHHGNGTPRSNS